MTLHVAFPRVDPPSNIWTLVWWSPGCVFVVCCGGRTHFQLKVEAEAWSGLFTLMGECTKCRLNSLKQPVNRWNDPPSPLTGVNEGDSEDWSVQRRSWAANAWWEWKPRYACQNTSRSFSAAELVSFAGFQQTQEGVCAGVITLGPVRTRTFKQLQPNLRTL